MYSGRDGVPGTGAGTVAPDMVVGLALASAVFYAVASVLQQHSAQAASRRLSLRPALLVALARRPLWLAGVAANVAAYGLRFAAIGHGSLVLVQPLVVSGLLVALPLAAAVQRRGMTGRDWLGALGVAAGLSVFLVAAAPSRGSASGSTGGWLVVLALLGGPALLLVAAARRLPRHQAALLAAGGGILLALAAGVTKVCAAALGRGVAAAATSWATYALVVVGLAGVVVVQSAFQAGPLSASLPVLSVVEPLVSIAVGRGLFREHLATRGPTVVVEVVALAVMGWGIVAVTTSPIVVGTGVRGVGANR